MTSDRVPQRRTIVVGVDGSSSSIDALRVAGSLVPLAGDVIHAVTAWQRPLVIGLYTPPDQDYEELASEALDRSLATAFPRGAPCTVFRTVLHGLPANTLVRHSEGASLLVIGSHGHGPTPYLSGPIGSDVTEGATCPVLVCHGTLQLHDDDHESPLPLPRESSPRIL